MTAFPIRQAILAGFGLARRRPGAIVGWFAFDLGKLLISGAILRWTAQMGYGSVAALVSMALGAGLAILATIAFDAILWAAAFRAFLRPEEGRFAYLRVGNLELCLMGLVFSWALVVGLFGQALTIAATEMRIHVSPFQILVGTGLGSLLGTLALVRFVMAPAVLLDCNRVSLLESWRLTHSIFWPLAGLLMAMQILRMVADWFGQALFLAFTEPAAFQSFGWLSLSHPHGALKTSVPQMMSVTQIVLDIYGAALAAIGVAMVAGIIATAYQAVTAGLEANGHDQTA